MSNGRHPLLAEQVGEGVWETTLDTSTDGLRWIPDHEIFTYWVMPAAGYLEMGVAVADALDGDGPRAVADVTLHRALFLSKAEPTVMRVEAQPDGDGEASFRVSSRQPDSDEFLLNAEGRIVAGGPPPEPVELDALRAQERVRIGADEHYAEFKTRGAVYGYAHHGVTEVWRRERDSFADIETPSGLDTAGYGVHPGVLDAAIQIPALHIEDAKGRMWLPIRIDRYQVHRQAPQSIVAHAIGYPVDEPRRLHSDLWVLDREGAPVAEITGLFAKRGGKK